MKMAPPRKTQQSSLDSFFGSKEKASVPASKQGPKQQKIDYFFPATNEMTKLSCDTEQKENAAVDYASTDSLPSKRKIPYSEKDSSDVDMHVRVVRKTTRSKRRVICDDSDDAEEAEYCDAINKEAALNNGSMEDIAEKKYNAGIDKELSDVADVIDTKKAAYETISSKSAGVAMTAAFDDDLSAVAKMPIKETKRVAKNGAVANDDESVSLDTAANITLTGFHGENTAGTASKTTKDGTRPARLSKQNQATSGKRKEAAVSTKKALRSSILNAAGKGYFKSDDHVLEEISSTSWDTEMPYSVLCQAFGLIEAVTSRLAIQEIMTNLFRQIMLKSCGDMSAVLYLASNSVAAAYECVELGIGDAILIRAIGQATGINPSMVKEKYETVGDLGSVAQTCKSKQSTLGGFFAVSTNAIKTYLTAAEVLKTFRQIAETKGNHAQKWKVEMIKKLLVRATDPAETKYIIRGLQGKLRIGLAQSTVLISLAHALALTVPKTIDITLDEEIMLGMYKFCRECTM